MQTAIPQRILTVANLGKSPLKSRLIFPSAWILCAVGRRVPVTGIRLHDFCGKKRTPFMQSFLPVSLDLLPFQDRSKDYPFICRLSVRERAIGRFKFYCQRFCFSLLLPDVSLLKVGTEGISCQSLDRLNRCGGEICCGKYSAASFQIAPVKRAVAVSAAESIRCIDV